MAVGVGEGDGSAVGEEVLVGFGGVAVLFDGGGISAVGGLATSMTVDSTAVEPAAGSASVGASAAVSGRVTSGAGRQPIRSPPRNTIPARSKKDVRAIGKLPLRCWFHISHPTKWIHFERPIAARGEA